jgi:hypothetical protein
MRWSAGFRERVLRFGLVSVAYVAAASCWLYGLRAWADAGGRRRAAYS